MLKFFFKLTYCFIFKKKNDMKTLIKRLYKELQELAKACPRETKWNA